MPQREQRLTVLENQVNRINRRLQNLYARSEQMTRWRLWAFLGGLFATLAALAVGPQMGLGNVFGLLVAAAAMVGFVYLVQQHNRVLHTIHRFEGWRTIKMQHLARMQLDWAALPEPFAAVPPSHPFANDLDLLGERSIHRLLDTTVSVGGGERLAQWLLRRKPDLEVIRQRHKLVKELTPLAVFRDKLILDVRLVTQHFRGRWDGSRLIGWLQNSEVIGPSRGTLLAIWGLAILNIVLFLLFSVASLPPLWIATWAAYGFAAGIQWRKLTGLLDQAFSLQNTVQRLRAIFTHLEKTSYQRHPALAQLCAPFKGEQRPSAQLKRIAGIVAAASLQRNPVVWLMLNLVIPWDLTVAYLLERSRKDLSDVLPRWLAVWYELEALSALANFAYLNPAYQFPVFDDQPAVAAVQIGHPMIPYAERVCNDVQLAQLGTVVLVTGSNMSGKSSFLRTVGVNLVLAYAGSVTAAQHFSCGLFRLFTCIHVTDSVVDGISYFYAEVKRLKALLDALRQDDALPLFFLIDEIFRGTNNRERLLGSQAYIEALIGGCGIGLISTHDLELVHLEENFDQLRNMHFRERVQDGAMVFDYQLRPGPSPTTNALKIMALEGLPVPPETGDSS